MFSKILFHLQDMAIPQKYCLCTEACLHSLLLLLKEEKGVFRYNVYRKTTWAQKNPQDYDHLRYAVRGLENGHQSLERI